MGTARRGHGAFGLGLATQMLFLSFSASLGAQERNVIRDEISCPTCRITTERLLDLGGPGDTTNIVHTNFLPMDSRGRVYFQSLYVPGKINVFDQQGRHIHSFGKEGEGPGEFESWAALLIGPGDSLHVVDTGNYRLSVFSPEWVLVRSSRISPPLRLDDGYFRADGSILVASIGRGPETFGLPLHVISPDGEVRQSFGGSGTIITSQDRRMLRRHVTPGPSGGVWASHVYRYLVEHRGSKGELLKTLERQTRSFPAPDGSTHTPATEDDPPPSSFMADIQADDNGLLWVLSWVAADDWKSAFQPDGKEPARVDLRDTIIEVIDPARGIVVARTRLDELAIGFSAPGVFYTYSDRSIFDQLTVWRIRLLTNPH